MAVLGLSEPVKAACSPDNYRHGTLGREFMIYLLLNIIFASAFTLIIKWVQVRDREDVITVGSINYIVAAVWTLPEFLQADFSPDSGAAVATGATMGFCYFVAYFFVIHSIRSIGAAATTVIGVLSILLPIGCGIFIWQEKPNEYQVVGVALALLALSLISGRPQDRTESKPETTGRSWTRPIVLVSFFLLAGTSRLAQEAFKHESDPVHRPTFLCTAFAVAAVPSIVLLIVRRRRISVSEACLGFAMGAANVLQTHYILKALKDYDGFVVFPVGSAGGLMLTTVVATALLGEHLDRRKAWGVGLAVFALVLLNW